MPDLTAIGFDADDTLWQNEQFYTLTRERYCELLKDHADPARLTKELDETERQAYAARSHTYLDHLAEAIHHSAPGVAGSTSPYRRRVAGLQRAREVDQAILAWVRARR